MRKVKPGRTSVPLLVLLSLSPLPLLCCSCSMLLVNTVPTKVVGALQAGATREALVARLGHPHVSDTIPPSATAKHFPGNANASLRDVYHVSGLMQMQGDPYWTDWNVYPAVVILSGGVVEVFMFPYVALDMTLRSFRRYEFIAWYDSSDCLIAFERRKRSYRN